MQTRISVVLPAPFGPTSAVTLPAGTARSTASSATFLRKRLLRPCAASATVPFEAPTSVNIPRLRLVSVARHFRRAVCVAGTVASRGARGMAGEPATDAPAGSAHDRACCWMQLPVAWREDDDRIRAESAASRPKPPIEGGRRGDSTLRRWAQDRAGGHSRHSAQLPVSFRNDREPSALRAMALTVDEPSALRAMALTVDESLP